MRTREDLVPLIQDDCSHWQSLLSEVGEDRMEEPGPMGKWTFKDLAAHLLGWREHTLAKLEAGPGANPPPAWPASLQTDDEINDWIYEQHRERPLHDVLMDVDRSYERLVQVIEAMPEDNLMTPGRSGIEGLEEMPLVELDFFGHLHEEHEPSIRAWLATRSGEKVESR